MNRTMTLMMTLVLIGSAIAGCAGNDVDLDDADGGYTYCLLYTSPSPRDRTRSRMPSSA